MITKAPSTWGRSGSPHFVEEQQWMLRILDLAKQQTRRRPDLEPAFRGGGSV